MEENKNLETQERLIILQFEDGSQVTLNVIDLIKVDDNDYAILNTLAKKEDQEIVIMRVSKGKNGDEFFFKDVDDEEELNLVLDVLGEKFDIVIE